MRYLFDALDLVEDLAGIEGVAKSSSGHLSQISKHEERAQREAYEKREWRRNANGLHLVRWKGGRRRFTAHLHEVHSLRGDTRLPCGGKRCQRCSKVLLPGMSVAEETWADKDRFYHLYWCFDC